MKINRIELANKIHTMIAEREKTAEARKAKALTEAEAAETKYVEEHHDDWTAFASRIRLRVRRGEAITIDDVPKNLQSGRSGWHPDVNLFRPSRVNESDYLPRTESLVRLLAVLESCPDEFISTTSLSQVGAPLKELMRP